jgi:hypothetical protein
MDKVLFTLPVAAIVLTLLMLNYEDILGIDSLAAKVIGYNNTFMYPVKFVCVPGVGPDSSPFVAQNYSTVINVHNPHSNSISLLKKAVLAQSEDEERGNISRLVKDMLSPDEALSVNCDDIAALFNGSKVHQIRDGFVVLISKFELDVSAVYTTKDSIDVEYIKPTLGSPAQLPDLTVNLPARTQVNCPSGQGSCIHTIWMEVTNLSNVPVNTPFSVEISTDNGLSQTLIVPFVLGSTTLPFPVDLGPSNNCYNPDCQVTAFVDSSDVILESDESNNVDVRLDIG